MGNLCSKSANQPDDGFPGPGRRLGGGPTESGTAGKTTHTVPPSIIATTPGRVLSQGAASPTSSDPRAAAARAAEERSKPVQGGPLATKLSKQKGKTQSQHLQDAAHENLRARHADETKQNTSYN